MKNATTDAKMGDKIADTPPYSLRNVIAAQKRISAAAKRFGVADMKFNRRVVRPTKTSENP